MTNWEIPPNGWRCDWNYARAFCNPREDLSFIHGTLYSECMKSSRALFTFLLLSCEVGAEEHVSYPTPDGGLIHGDLYGTGERAVVLAHGGRHNKQSWKKQALELEKAGFRVLAIDFRGLGKSRGPGDTKDLREGDGAEGTDHRRRVGPRPIPLRDRSGRAGHARDLAFDQAF